MIKYDQTYIKNELLTKFPLVSSIIMSDTPCYAVSCCWYRTFSFEPSH